MPKLTTFHKEDLLFETHIGAHRVLCEASEDNDRAPAPPDYFVASLGSCVAAKVASYCQEAGLDITNMSVDVTYDRAQHPERLVNLKVTINLPHVDGEHSRLTIENIAKHCMIYDTVDLMTAIEFDVQDQSDLSQLMAAPYARLLKT